MPLGWAPNMHVNTRPTMRVQTVSDAPHEPADHLSAALPQVHLRCGLSFFCEPDIFVVGLHFA